MAREEISVDALLKAQGADGASLLATIEPVTDDDSKVRVTPFVAETGCSCAQAITVPKKDIKTLYTTDDVHWCCGKKLTVVEVEFVHDSLTDVVRQLGEMSRRAAPPPMPNQDMEPRSLGGIPRELFGRFAPGRQRPTPARFTTWDAITCGIANDVCQALCAQIALAPANFTGMGAEIYRHCSQDCQTSYEHCLGYPF